MATHSAWKTPWTEELAGYRPWGHRVRRDWVTSARQAVCGRACLGSRMARRLSEHYSCSGRWQQSWVGAFGSDVQSDFPLREGVSLAFLRMAVCVVLRW